MRLLYLYLYLITNKYIYSATSSIMATEGLKIPLQKLRYELTSSAGF
jgi:hypothetical protein